LTGERAGQPLSHEMFLIQDADVVTYAEGKRTGATTRVPERSLACTDALCLGTGRSPVWPFAVKGWSVSGRRGAVADDERTGEVRPFHSSCEAANKTGRSDAVAGSQSYGSSLGPFGCRAGMRSVRRCRYRARVFVVDQRAAWNLQPVVIL
jgi:hypothetical protein